ncbi:unnamed protein product [Aphanomyces euteiches]|uniref:Uncharacterized protein n=1 Tax=Aphanomyces euteiches TaxID=100861 RepID=A0A6G0WV23_9STRA|nr:hypothetical protein Ae201684_011378 [Aphanomyces euteiches]KAH9100690.1 hypothetical protein Ae201684P_006885 [Aphanomyces euteiches]
MFFWKKDVSSLTKSLHHLLHEVAPALPEEDAELGDVDVLAVDVSADVERLVVKLRNVVCGTPDAPIQTDECAQVVDMLVRYHVLERLIHPDLLVQVSFDAQKAVGAMVKAMVHQHGAIVEPVVCQVSFLTRLCQGYTCPTTPVVLVCGGMLRDVLDTFPQAIELFLSNMPSEFDSLITIACTHAHFEVSSDALANISSLLTHPTPALEATSSNIFLPYQRLLTSSNFATQRHALQILSKVLLDPRNSRIMMQYISDKAHLKVIMTLLREQSDALRVDAFHVFKIFVANPSKTPDIEQMLRRNKEKLVKFVVDFGQEHANSSSPNLASEVRLLVFTLEKLAAVSEPSSASSSGGNPSTAAAVTPHEPPQQQQPQVVIDA